MGYLGDISSLTNKLAVVSQKNIHGGGDTFVKEVFWHWTMKEVGPKIMG